MKRACLALIVVLICAGAVYAFEREAPVLPTISEPLAVLESATGWMRIPEGGWVSRENRIPKYLSSEYDVLQDYQEHALGVDNFGWLQLREMGFGGQSYYLLLKQYRSGYYRYSNIREGWTYSERLKVYVINKSDFPPPIKLEDGKATLIEIPVAAQFERFYPSDRYVDEIAAKVAEGLEETDSYLLVNMLRIGDAGRFVMLVREDVSTAGATIALYDGIDKYEKLPIKFEEVLTEEVFRNFYYELDYEALETFWNVWREE